MPSFRFSLLFSIVLFCGVFLFGNVVFVLCVFVVCGDGVVIVAVVVVCGWIR